MKAGVRVRTCPRSNLTIPMGELKIAALAAIGLEDLSINAGAEAFVLYTDAAPNRCCPHRCSHRHIGEGGRSPAPCRPRSAATGMRGCGTGMR